MRMSLLIWQLAETVAEGVQAATAVTVGRIPMLLPMLLPMLPVTLELTLSSDYNIK
jgi:hypothetical protein